MGEQLYGYSPAEHEYSVKVPEITTGEAELVIYLSAHGGGTVGEEYRANGWDYLVTEAGRPVLEGSDLRSGDGRAAGHAEMARTLASFLASDGESFAYHPGRAELTAHYSAEEAAWLAANHERLSSFAGED